MLDKKALIAGNKNTTKVKLPQYNNEEINIREISDYEYQNFKTNYNDMGNITIKGETQLIKTNMKKVDGAKNNAMMELVKVSLNNDENEDKYSLEDVKQFKSGTIKYLTDKILEFCDLPTTDQMEEEAQIEAAKMKALEKKAERGELEDQDTKDLANKTDDFPDDE